jgi:hypothetical protein
MGEAAPAGIVAFTLGQRAIRKVVAPGISLPVLALRSVPHCCSLRFCRQIPDKNCIAAFVSPLRSTSLSMHRAHWAAPALLLLLAACPSRRSGEVVDLAAAQSMAVDSPLVTWPAAGGTRPVLLYVDRSQSMRGFLDPEYPARVATDYRSVLDGFDARLRPSRVFGYGDDVLPTESAGLGVLGSRDFYADGNTELDRVFPLVDADSALGSTHVIIGDGRRGSPDAANGQYVRMRALAERWIEKGGTFIVAASAAPFRPVENDPAGCRASGDAAGQTCPLYAFAFVAPGEQGRVAAALAAVFQNLYVTPLPAVGGAEVRMASEGRAEITLEPEWTAAADGTPIVRVRGRAQTNQPLRATLALRDTTSPAGRAALLALRGRRLVPVLAVRTLGPDPAASPWSPSAAAGALMQPSAEDPFAYDFISRGTGKEASRSLYRLQLHPAGDPSWLDAFDAESAGDALRTYGLGRLFESFVAADPASAPPVLRSYVVVN